MKDNVNLNLNIRSAEKTTVIISQTNVSVSTAVVLCPGCMLESLESFQDTDSWVLFPRDRDFIDVRCSLGVGSLGSSPGNFNGQQSWEPHLCRVGSVVFLCHSRHQVDGTSRPASLF